MPASQLIVSMDVWEQATYGRGFPPEGARCNHNLVMSAAYNAIQSI